MLIHIYMEYSAGLKLKKKLHKFKYDEIPRRRIIYNNQVNKLYDYIEIRLKKESHSEIY